MVRCTFVWYFSGTPQIVLGVEHARRGGVRAVVNILQNKGWRNALSDVWIWSGAKVRKSCGSRNNVCMLKMSLWLKKIGFDPSNICYKGQNSHLKRFLLRLFCSPACKSARRCRKFATIPPPLSPRSTYLGRYMQIYTNAYLKNIEN